MLEAILNFVNTLLSEFGKGTVYFLTFCLWIQVFLMIAKARGIDNAKDDKEKEIEK